MQRRSAVRRHVPCAFGWGNAGVGAAIPRDSEGFVDELLRYTRALVFLQLQQVTGADTFGRPELLLARAGFPHREIADLLGKSPAAVAKAISRGRAAARRAATEEDPSGGAGRD